MYPMLEGVAKLFDVERGIEIEGGPQATGAAAASADRDDR